MKKKFLVSVMLIMIGLLVAEGLNQRMAYAEYDNEVYELNAHVLSFYMNYVETVFERIDATTGAIAGDQNLHKELTFIKECYKKEGYSQNLYDANIRIRNYFQKEPYFKYFLLKTENYRFSYGGLIVNEKEIDNYLASVNTIDGSLQRIYEDGRVIMIRAIRMPTSNNYVTLGHIIAFVDFRKIIEDMQSAFPNDNKQFDIAIYHEDICLYTNNKELSRYLKNEDGWQIEGNLYSIKKAYPELGYQVILQTDYSDVQNELEKTANRANVVFVIITAISLLLCVKLITGVTVELEKMVTLIDSYAHGKKMNEAYAGISLYRNDEIGRLYRHFFQMTTDYNKLLENYYANKMLLAELEFSWLQKQIHPHLLYNTLSAIEWTAYANRDTETARMVSLLGRLMRRVTDTKDIMISLEKEMDIVMDYIAIQQLRVGDRLQLHTKISQETLQLLVPKMSIQPLVENSIVHGLDKMLGVCEVSIYERQQPNGVEIVVRDNGPGCNENILEEIDNLKQKSLGDGIALKNIHRRLQHAYQENPGLRFVRTEEGMEISFIIPKDIEDERLSL